MAYLCTPNRPSRQSCSRLLIPGVLALLLVVVSLPVSAQDGRTRQNNASATLHISAVIVPAALVLPARQNSTPQSGPVIYNLSDQQQAQMSITRQTHLLSEGVVLKTVTVVSE